MDLALNMGMPAAQLRQEMTERELVDWSRYAIQKGLPWARVEELLARLVMILDLVHMQPAGTRGNVVDYLPRRSAEDVQRDRVARAIEADGSEA